MIVLNYHNIVAGVPPDDWSLTEAQFRAHMDVCANRLIAPTTFLDRCHDPAHARTDAVLVTCDDGNLSDYTHVFGRYMTEGLIPGFMSFIPVAQVGDQGRMTWPMIEELGRRGVTIGSHGMDHVDLARASDAALDSELRRSRAILEDRIGLEVTQLAFPFGRFSRRVWQHARAAGYTHLFTIQLGHHQGFERFLFSRLCVTNTMAAETLRRHVADPDATRNRAWRISNALRLYGPLMRLRYGIMAPKG